MCGLRNVIYLLKFFGQIFASFYVHVLEIVLQMQPFQCTRYKARSSRKWITVQNQRHFSKFLNLFEISNKYCTGFCKANWRFEEMPEKALNNQEDGRRSYLEGEIFKLWPAYFLNYSWSTTIFQYSISMNLWLIESFTGTSKYYKISADQGWEVYPPSYAVLKAKPGSTPHRLPLFSHSGIQACITYKESSLVTFRW